jgi:hypothetical protein
VPAEANLHFVRLAALERSADGGNHRAAIVGMNQVAPAVTINPLQCAARVGDPRGVDEVHRVVGAQRPHHARLRFGQQAITFLALVEQLATGQQILFLRFEATSAAMADLTEPAGDEAEDEEERDGNTVAEVVERKPRSLDEEPRGDRAEDGGENTRPQSSQPTREENDEEERAKRPAAAEITDDVTDERGRARSDESNDVSPRAS